MPSSEKFTLQLAYAPAGDSNLLDSCMTTISNRLSIDAPVAYPTSESLESGLLRHGYIAGLDFTATEIHTRNATQMPAIWRFAIRFPAAMRSKWDSDRPATYNWKTDALFPAHSDPRQEDMPGYRTEGFLAIFHRIAADCVLNATLMPHLERTRRLPLTSYRRDELADFFGSGFIAVLILLVFWLPTTNAVWLMAHEREQHLKTILRRMGVPNYVHWLGWLLRSLLLSLVIVTLLTALLKMPVNDAQAVLANSDWTALWLFLFTYSLSLLGFGFMLSVLIRRASVAVGATACVFFVLLVLGIVGDEPTTPTWLKWCLSLLMNAGFWLAFRVLAEWEMALDGLTWENWWTKRAESANGVAVGEVVVIFVLDFVLYSLIALFVERYWPVKYTVANKFRSRSARFNGRPTKAPADRDGDKYNNPQPFDQNFFEAEPPNRQPTVQIRGLSKRCADGWIVHPMFMNLFANQITVLLGHSGAGKTTTMNMLMGLARPPSDDAVRFSGRTAERPDGSGGQQVVGICPQWNILYDELTGEEHIRFYSRLKGETEEGGERALSVLKDRLRQSTFETAF